HVAPPPEPGPAMTPRSRLPHQPLTIHLDEDVWGIGVSGGLGMEGVTLAEPIRAMLERAPRNAFVPRIRDVTCTAGEAETLAAYLSRVADILATRDRPDAAMQCLRAQRSVRYALRRAGRSRRQPGSQ